MKLSRDGRRATSQAGSAATVDGNFLEVYAGMQQPSSTHGRSVRNALLYYLVLLETTSPELDPADLTHLAISLAWRMAWRGGLA